ncbi:MAG: haloacid dehalogenase, partial [Gammaproteobacteria bacterium]|nr:haloacid dehalogenase [Gammaproteobacteria bacterium]
MLDMDGTLLDLHFDSHFWLEYVPQKFAEENDMTYESAKQELLGRYREVEGTLEWYCVDHWSR